MPFLGISPHLDISKRIFFSKGEKNLPRPINLDLCMAHPSLQRLRRPIRIKCKAIILGWNLRDLQLFNNSKKICVLVKIRQASLCFALMSTISGKCN